MWSHLWPLFIAGARALNSQLWLLMLMRSFQGSCMWKGAEKTQVEKKSLRVSGQKIKRRTKPERQWTRGGKEAFSLPLCACHVFSPSAQLQDWYSERKLHHVVQMSSLDERGRRCVLSFNVTCPRSFKANKKQLNYRFHYSLIIPTGGGTANTYWRQKKLEVAMPVTERL